jgi:hypothetical protein
MEVFKAMAEEMGFEVCRVMEIKSGVSREIVKMVRV